MATTKANARLVAFGCVLFACIPVITGCGSGNNADSAADLAPVIITVTADEVPPAPLVQTTPTSELPTIEGEPSISTPVGTTTVYVDPAPTVSVGQPAPNKLLPIGEPIRLIFSSGAGGWATGMILDPDGSFYGAWFDGGWEQIGSELIEVVESEDFFGEFEIVEIIDDYTISLRLREYQTAYGLEGGDEFFLYAPGRTVLNLDEMFRLEAQYNTTNGRLTGWALHNVAQSYGWFEAEPDEWGYWFSPDFTAKNTETIQTISPTYESVNPQEVIDEIIPLDDNLVLPIPLDDNLVLPPEWKY